MTAPTAMDEPSQTDGPALPPTRTVALMRRLASPIWLRVGIAAVLEVPGRRTGTPRSVTLVPVEVDGTSYLMAFSGLTDWARNLRTAGRGELRRKGRTEAFTAIEVDGNERDRAIAAYLARLPKPVRKDFDRRPGAADHPTFRVEPIR
jgi:deazaflavin-dependent oxidoreductase (nitroreductase family)